MGSLFFQLKLYGFVHSLQNPPTDFVLNGTPSNIFQGLFEVTLSCVEAAFLLDYLFRVRSDCKRMP